MRSTRRRSAAALAVPLALAFAVALFGAPGPGAAVARPTSLSSGPAATGAAWAGRSAAAVRLGQLASQLRAAGGPRGRADAAAAVTGASGTLSTADGRRVDLGFASPDIALIGGADQRIGRQAALRLAARLDALAAALPADAGALRPVQDRRLLASILSEKDFRSADPASRAFVAFVEAVQRWLEGLTGSATAGSADPVWVRVLLVLLLVAVLGAGAVAVFRFVRHRSGTGSVPEQAHAADGGSAGRGGDVEAAARRLVDTGDLDGAMRVLFSAIPPSLVAAGLLPARREVTNREMVLTVGRRRPTAATTLSRLVAVFERCFYGQRRIQPEEWQGFTDGWVRLRSEIEAEAS